MKTESNPKGSGRKPRPVPGTKKAFTLDNDLVEWLEQQRDMSAVVNLALRDFRNRFDFMLPKSD